MSRNWTNDEISAASTAMQRQGNLSYDEFIGEIEKQDKERTTEYKYYSPRRPIGLGTVPKCFTRFEDWPSRPYCSAAGCECWGMVVYSRILTPREVYDYELIPS